MDDAAIVSRTFTEHLKHLQIIFQTVRANNMRLNPTKTNIEFNQIEFLGFSVSNKKLAYPRAYWKPLNAWHNLQERSPCKG